MLKKVLGFTLIVFLITNVLNPFSAFANGDILSYEQILNELENTKEDINVGNDMTVSQKESIREQNYKLVNDFLDANHNFDKEKVNILLTSLEDIDSLMYDLEKEKGNVNFGSKSTNYSKSDVEQGSLNRVEKYAASNSWNGKGDILISMTAKTYGFPHGHAAILSTTPHYVIEALSKPGVVHQSASKYWSTVSDEGQYYVKGAPDSAYIKAVNYAKVQIGELYKLKTSLSNTSEWYCSKLVYKAWQSAGYHVGTLDAYAGVVLPESIRVDADTVKYKSNPY